MVDIASGVRISEHELQFTAERSPGPGGENVNKTNTRVTLHFDVSGSTSLSGTQKSRIQEELANRINKEGVLKIVSSKERTQLANRRAATSRLIELLKEVFTETKPRRKTKPPASVDAKRLNGKAKRSEVKRLRSAVSTND